MKKILFFALTLMVYLFNTAGYAKDSFPINIAVEFTNHAASAYIAQHKGWFEEEGIKPTFYNYVTGMALASALGRGDIQAAYMCLVPAINAYANAKIPIKVVAGLHKHGYGLAVNPSKVKTIKDLEREDIRIGAVQKGGPVDAFLIKTIERYGLDRDKILNRVNRMNPPMQIMAIRAGRIDASFSPEHWPAIAEDAGFRMLITSQDVWPHMQGSIIIVKEELIKNHPEVVRRLVKINEKSTAWIKQHPQEAATIMTKQLQATGEKIFPIEIAELAQKFVITPETVYRSMKRLDYITDIDIRAVQDFIDFAVKQGYIKEGFSAKDILDMRFSK